jgi:hypothetical protein
VRLTGWSGGLKPLAPKGQGGVAKWPKATVCKTVIREFESHRRLQPFMAVSCLFLVSCM